MPIEFRGVTEDDIPYLIHITKKYKHLYLDDSEEQPDDPYILQAEMFNMPLLLEERTLIFTALTPEGRRPIGFTNFSPIKMDLLAYIHFLMEPKYLRQFLNEKTYLLALLDRFQATGVKKFLAETSFFAKSSHTLLKTIGFKQTARLKDYFSYKGRVGDLFTYELTRQDLAQALALKFISDNKPKRRRKQHVNQKESEKSFTAQESIKPVRQPVRKQKRRVLQPDISAGTARHPEPSADKRSRITEEQPATDN